eukprot:Sspe_Gene.55938::Locus_30777_Transcript_1_4_Confidence_0.692_Length_2199::g.55938::m.55938/K10532/HGSNAT; heparan-alpha-glucosaminide N-acetyltransferase
MAISKKEHVLAASPVILGLVVLITWLAYKTPTPWNLGWELSIPFFCLMPIWAALMLQFHAVRAGKGTWRGFPGTAYTLTTLLIVVWSVAFISKALANPEICGPIPTNCKDGRLVLQGRCIDMASVEVAPQHLDYQYDILVRYHNCWECIPQRVATAGPGEVQAGDVVFTLQTDHAVDIHVVQANVSKGVQYTKHLTDQARYQLVLVGEKEGIFKTKDGPVTSGPFLVVLACCVVIQVVYVYANKVADRMLSGDSLVEAMKAWRGSGEEGTPILDVAPEAPRKRVLALDVLRGLSLVVMNVANYGGMGYWYLNHSSWDGLTVADLVFPWFIWIMGVAMAIALEGKRVQQDTTAALIHVLRRSALLFLIGLFLETTSLPSFKRLRIPGVLQRFALSYFFVGVGLFAARRGGGEAETTVQDIEAGESAWVPTWHSVRTATLATLREAPFFVGLAVLWLAVSLGVKIHSPDGQECPRGYLGPGGVSQHSRAFGCTGGVARWLDEKMFGQHVWDACFPCSIYMEYDMTTMTCRGTPTHDPEGMLGSLNSIVLCWLGLVAGRIVRVAQQGKITSRQASTALGLLGGLLCLIAGCMCEFKQFGGAVPVNKNLWSLSFILVMAGTGTLLLLVLLWAVDWAQFWAGKPFLFVGMNSIVYYTIHEVMQSYVPFNSVLEAPSTHASEALHVSLGVTTNIIVVYWLWRNNLFLRL